MFRRLQRWVVIVVAPIDYGTGNTPDGDLRGFKRSRHGGTAEIAEVLGAIGPGLNPSLPARPDGEGDLRLGSRLV
jgi:hypothetical protein